MWMAFKIDLDPNSELETVGFQDGYGPDGHGPDGQGWPSGAALNCFDLRCEGMMGGQQMGMGMKGMQAPFALPNVLISLGWHAHGPDGQGHAADGRQGHDGPDAWRHAGPHGPHGHDGHAAADAHADDAPGRHADAHAAPRRARGGTHAGLQPAPDGRWPGLGPPGSAEADYRGEALPSSGQATA